MQRYVTDLVQPDVMLQPGTYRIEGFEGVNLVGNSRHEQGVLTDIGANVAEAILPSIVLGQLAPDITEGISQKIQQRFLKGAVVVNTELNTVVQIAFIAQAKEILNERKIWFCP